MNSEMKVGEILVVDDDAMNRQVVALTLEHAGFATTPASDGEEALELILTAHFDAVVTDIDMPRMNGLELLQNIRSRFPWLPVIVTTGLADDEVIDAALADGAVAVFQKPVGRDDLIAAVALGLRRGSLALRQPIRAKA